MNRYLPKIIAHRGASAHAPENTLMAIRLAKDMGAEAVEIDVCLTKDRQPAVTHNHDLQKIFGIEGYVFDITFAQLKKYNTSFKFDNKLQKTSVPHLREVLSLCQDLSLMLNIELKPINGDEQELAQAVDDVLKQFPNFWDLIW
ncbi:MAG: hypothetical protein HRT87_08705, partial [Legionellales bacterium]|nr:hypothetical protein [Legionellales bacterium]